MAPGKEDAMPDRVAPLGESVPVRLQIQLGDGAMSYLAWDDAAAAPSSPREEWPALLFTHATGFNAQTYRTLLAPLAAEFRIFAVDLRGHGATTLPADPERMTEWDIHRNDLLAFLDQLMPRHGLRAPMLLGGHSLGASLSLLVAEARPDLVGGLVLAEPVIMPYGYHWWLWLARRLGLRHRASPLAEMAARRRAVFDSRDAVLVAYRGRGAFRTWPETMLRDYVEAGTRPRADGTVDLACAPAREPAKFRPQPTYLWRRIRRVRCPLSVLCGTIDSTCPPQIVRRLIRLRPDAGVVTVGGASHFLPMERPDLVRETLREMRSQVFGALAAPE
jgi:pimeloyl-ACP methyl ester carboxylesterase